MNQKSRPITFEHSSTTLLTCTLSLDAYRSVYQNVDYFLTFCQNCRNYGQQWVCPPFDFDPNAILDRYKEVEIFGAKRMISLEEQALALTTEEMIGVANRVAAELRREMDPQLLRLEEEREGSLAFYAGSCYLCPKGSCTRVATPPSPCRYPQKARHSLENFGFDLGRTASELLHTPMLWGKDGHLPPYYLYIAGLLY